jgi:hypothetical protein
LQQVFACLDAPGEQHRSAQQGLPALGKELFKVLDPLISHHEGCLLLSLSKYEGSSPPVTLHLAKPPSKEPSR